MDFGGEINWHVWKWREMEQWRRENQTWQIINL